MKVVEDSSSAIELHAEAQPMWLAAGIVFMLVGSGLAWVGDRGQALFVVLAGLAAFVVGLPLYRVRIERIGAEYELTRQGHVGVWGRRVTRLPVGALRGTEVSLDRDAYRLVLHLDGARTPPLVLVHGGLRDAPLRRAADAIDAYLARGRAPMAPPDPPR